MAQEALASAALGWQERAERLAESKARLKNRLAEVEEAHRKYVAGSTSECHVGVLIVLQSLTVVKNVPALPNNHVFTKQLVDENHALRQETRALQRRLMQTPATADLKEEDCAKKNEDALGNQPHPKTSPATFNLVELAQHPLLQELKTHLRDLEVDLDRLRQENELLRAELDQYEDIKKPAETRTLSKNEDKNANIDEEDQEQLRASVDTLLQQVKVLEARYQLLEEKREPRQRFVRGKQQLAAQTEKLQVYSDQTAQLDDLQQDLHLLRSENMKLNETIAVLSSRPFDALSKDLQKKNLWISQLEEEKRVLEEDRARFQTDCLATRRTNDKLRHRVEAMTDEVKNLANELSRAKAECEQKAMEKEVAQLQLRFYTAPGHYRVMSSVGKAIKDMKKQQQAKRTAAEDESKDSLASKQNSMIFTSRHPTLPIPDNAAIWYVVEQHARHIGDKPAFVCGVTGRTISYAQLLRMAKKICAGLAANGLQKGDIVILHSMNCIEYPVIFLALNRLGAICSQSSPQFTARELADQIEAAQAVAVISHKKFAAVAMKAATMHDISSDQVYTIGDGGDSSFLQTIEHLIEMDLPFPDLPPIDPNQVVTLPFSSGTTGRPKGVELTARAMFAAGMIPAYTVEKMDYLLGMLPFFHIMATLIFHISLYMGMSMVVLPGFQPNTLLHTAAKYKIKRLHLAPPLIKFLAKHPLELEQAVLKRLNVQVLQSYGMTEIAGVKCLETGADLPPNMHGELLFRGPTIMKGYFNNPEATRESFTKDGFLLTGDIGYIDDDGFVFIVDRLKELIKYKGHQVAPAEVEDVVNSHPQVADSGCVRGHDPMTGEEIPKVYVVLEDGSSLTADELMEYVAAKVTGYKCVREVEFVDSIPKSLSGKILRRVLQMRENEKIRASRSRL
ncbi:AMP-binding enzyme C-terminal domain [Phytophthora cactorum]|nr:AMP-binding enzyme C-terminal domain [Phytophthora cactorum]